MVEAQPAVVNRKRAPIHGTKGLDLESNCRLLKAALRAKVDEDSQGEKPINESHKSPDRHRRGRHPDRQASVVEAMFQVACAYRS